MKTSKPKLSEKERKQKARNFSKKLLENKEKTSENWFPVREDHWIF